MSVPKGSTWIELRCPRCSSDRMTKVDEDHYRCHYCEGVFRMAAPAAPAAPAVATAPGVSTAKKAPGPQSRGQRALAIVGAVAAVAGLATVRGLVRASLRTPPSPPRPAVSVNIPAFASLGTTTAPAPLATVQAPPPAAELRDVRSGRLRSGAAVWLGMYTNTGAVPIAAPAAVVSLFDAAERRVAEQQGYAARPRLEPGESVPLLVLVAKAPAFAKAEVAVAPPRAAQWEAPVVALTVKDFAVRSSGVGAVAVGTVVNASPEPVRFARVVVAGRSADGKLASLADGLPTKTELAPGVASGFQVHLGTFELEKPARYDVSATAQVASR